MAMLKGSFIPPTGKERIHVVEDEMPIVKRRNPLLERLGTRLPSGQAVLRYWRFLHQIPSSKEAIFFFEAFACESANVRAFNKRSILFKFIDSSAISTSLIWDSA